MGLADDGVKPSHEAISSIAEEASINAVDLLLDEEVETELEVGGAWLGGT